MILRQNFLSKEAISDMQLHALEAFPEEAAGALTPEGYVRLQNICSDPTKGVMFEDRALANLEDEGRLLGVFHSHPSTPDHPAPFCPSEGDMISQKCSGVPYLLAWTDGEICSSVAVWGDELEPLPLIGRQFHHGITDCYELIRDFYLLAYDVRLPQFPRDWEWWAKGKELYRDGFAKAGFRQISPTEVLPGDVALFTIRSDTPNHGGIVLDRGLLLHHVTGTNAYEPCRLSNTTPIGRYLKFDPIWLRYNENDQTIRRSWEEVRKRALP